jgi:hypothetical protein
VLTRVLARAALAIVAAALLMTGLQSPALAGGGPGGGTSFGSVTCGQSYAPSCAVSAGSQASNGTPGTQQGGRPGGTSAIVATGGGAASGCSGTVSKTWGCIPAGCNVTVQTLACPLGVGGAAPPPAAAPPPVPPAPGVLAQLAVRYLILPSPVIRSSPAPGDLQLTRLPVWLWINPAAWEPESKTASVPGESVTATATPVTATWRTGDGATVTCHGPGIPYSSRYAPSSSSPDCGHTYTTSSAAQPGGAYHVTVTITWDITWTGPDGAAGALPPLQTAAAAEFRVAESQAVNTSGGL